MDVAREAPYALDGLLHRSSAHEIDAPSKKIACTRPKRSMYITAKRWKFNIRYSIKPLKLLLPFIGRLSSRIVSFVRFRRTKATYRKPIETIECLACLQPAEMPQRSQYLHMNERRKLGCEYCCADDRIWGETAAVDCGATWHWRHVTFGQLCNECRRRDPAISHRLLSTRHGRSNARRRTSGPDRSGRTG